METFPSREVSSFSRVRCATLSQPLYIKDLFHSQIEPDVSVFFCFVFCDTSTQAKHKLFYSCICKYCMHNRIVVHQRINGVRWEALLFCRKENLFINVYQYVLFFFLTKKGKKKKVTSEDICWVCMYSFIYNVWLGKTSRFCLNAFSLLRASLLLRSDVPGRSSFGFVLSGPRSLHSLPVCCV